MNKSDLITAISEKCGLTKKDSEKAYAATFSAIADALQAGERIQILGFGTFEVRDRAARVGKNPSTGARLEIPAARYPAFKAGKALKETVAQG
jgi:DNA-binding protein HU-beta